MSPSLREISMFIAVAEEQSFTAAAVREHATQSGVSQHIRNLEDRLGVPLLTRGKNIRPTPAGAAYYRRCLEVLKAHAVARRTLDEYATGLSGEVVIGLIPTMTRAVLAPTCLSFTAKHPNVRLRVVEAFSGLLANALRGGELDFAILPRTPALTTGVKSTLFTRTPEFLVSAPNQTCPDGTPVRLAELQGLKLVMPGTANARRHMLEQYLTEQCVQIDSRMELDSVLGTLDLVARSDWHVIFPGVLLGPDIGSGRYSINILAEPGMMLNLYLVEPERQPLSAAAAAFLDTLRAVTDEVNTLPMRFAQGTPTDVA